MDWLNVLDFERALINCHDDMLGDWYRDPWGWPEADWLVTKRPDLLVARLNAKGIQASAKLDVPKENFGTRPAIVMDPVDRVIYQALVDRSSRALIGDMKPWVYGWRLPRTDPDSGRYTSNKDEWEWYRSRMSWLSGNYPYGLVTDVVSFFASIPIDRLCEQALAKAGGGALADRLVDMLQGWARMQGRTGLPQRSKASAALANMYLYPLDDVLQAVSAKSRVLGVQTTTRWMDDMWVFARKEGVLRRAQVAIEAVLRDLDLNMATGKTHVLGGEELINAAREVEHSAADDRLSREPPDPTALQALVDRLLASPEVASRTSIKFATTRIRDHKLTDMIEQFSRKAARMPHGADALGRLFREEEHWRDLELWYVKHARSSWGVHNWSVAQLGTMFPSTDPGRGDVRDFLLQSVVDLPPIQMMALSLQRSVAWDRDRARQAIREAAPSAHHPLDRRLLALAAVSAGEERALVRALLREFEQNDVTLQMLEARQFRPVRVKADFG